MRRARRLGALAGEMTSLKRVVVVLLFKEHELVLP